MIDLHLGWKLHVDRSPDWIFCRLTADQPHLGGEPLLAQAIVDEAKAAGVSRAIFEIDDSVMLVSYLVGQVVSLHKRFLIEGGVFRICGFSTLNYDVLRTLHLADRFPNYRDREAAVLGHLS